MFEDVNVAFLNKFEAYLMGKERKKGALNGNSTTSNLRAIRTIIYKAIEEDKFIGKNPFSIKRLKEFKVVKGKLSIADIKKLESLNLDKGSRLWHTLNYFLFSFYAAGIRFADVAQLKWENIIDDRLSFTIDKTEEGHSLKLIPKALAILDNYKSLNNKPNSYIFPMLDELPIKYDSLMLHNLVSSQNALINRNLKDVQDLAEINTKMTFHLSRHSFADILRTKKASIYDISKLLGHSDIKITQRYLKGFDNITSDEALTSGMDF
jgi:integrase